MAVDVSWIDEVQSIVLYQFSADWTWEELYPAFEKALSMEQSVPHRVDVVLDVRVGLKLPSNTISNIVSIAKKQPPNLKLSVFVTERAYLHAIVDVVRSLSPVAKECYVTAKTVEEALKIIDTDRAKAPTV